MTRTSPLNLDEHQRYQCLLKQNPIISEVDAHVRLQGGKVLLVGGAVRNIIMHLPITDIDVEVYGVSIADLQCILSHYGRVDYVGKSFGVLRVVGFPIDWAIPRKDQSGRKPEVTLIPDLPVEVALRRRDVTMNSMAIDCGTGHLYDPFGGRNDIAGRVLRASDPVFFSEDPLRFYRVMQFISRFNCYPDEQLTNICQRIDLTSVSQERIAGEFEKMLLKSLVPSRGIRWLASINRLKEIMPELYATQGVLQHHVWHPEGDVFEHTMQVIDAAAIQEYPNQELRKIIMYTALCHDLGKAVSTNIIDGIIRSRGHETSGIPLAKALMTRIAGAYKLTAAVVRLVRHHMVPGQIVANAALPRAYKRLACELSPRATIRMLSLLAYADHRGRNAQQGTPLSIPVPEVDAFVAQAIQAGVFDSPEKAILSGEDIRDFVPEGPLMGRVLQHAYELQINRNIQDKAELIRRVKTGLPGKKG
jgi:tRNA nucleotidyltransferase (CCA-adding enzyme)